MKNRILVLLMAMLVTTGLSAQINFFNEKFDDNKNGWPFLGNHEGYSLAIQNGHLRIESTSDVGIQTFINPNVNKEDYGLSAKMILEKGDAEGFIGIRFGMSEDGESYYSFLYDNTGFYGVYKYDKKMKKLSSGKAEGVVKKFEYNDLLVIKEGKKFSFEINGEQIYSANLKTFGDFIAIKTSPRTTVMVDEINIYDDKKASDIANSALDKMYKDLGLSKGKGGK
ncbi:hypothetical protein [Roseivirga sp.]|uniref:hypothetical protein n=1 Tax=Roseivirga sp. TaxID=1964215 RepID=UPI002B268FFC|nr:hypothetical protein [Roseivirga sp.]